MIRHIVIFTFKDDVTSVEKKTILGSLAKFLANFNFIKVWTIQPNISAHDKTFEYVVALDFEAREDLERYFSSEEHLTFAKGVIRPRLSQRAVISFTSDAPYQETDVGQPA